MEPTLLDKVVKFAKSTKGKMVAAAVVLALMAVAGYFSLNHLWKTPKMSGFLTGDVGPHEAELDSSLVEVRKVEEAAKNLEEGAAAAWAAYILQQGQKKHLVRLDWDAKGKELAGAAATGSDIRKFKDARARVEPKALELSTVEAELSTLFAVPHSSGAM